MSIVVAVRVGDGLVLAADSASTISVIDPTGQSRGVAKVFNNASKLMQLRDYPIGVASWGAGTIGARTISSLVEEFANSRPRLVELGKDGAKLSVRAEAKALQEFLIHAHSSTAGPEAQNQQVVIGVLVGGYSGREFFPEEYMFNIPQGEFLQRREPLEDGRQNFGADWFGISDALVRFHYGRDDRLPSILERFSIPEETIKKVMETFRGEVQYPVPFDGMPLQDAVDYALFMAGLAVARFRFVIGPEMCGGPIDVAAITRQGGFSWVKQKGIEARAWVPTK